jgi:hypothetical protein
MAEAEDGAIIAGSGKPDTAREGRHQLFSSTVFSGRYRRTISTRRFRP